MEPEQYGLRVADSGVPPVQNAAEPAAPTTADTLPPDALILISTRNLVLFPGTVLPVTLGRQRSIVAAQTAIRLNRPVGHVLQRDVTHDDPLPADLYSIST